MTDSSVGKKSGTITWSYRYIRKAVFWGAGPCTLMDSRQRLGGNGCFHLQDTVRPAHLITQRYTPEVHNVNTVWSRFTTGLRSRICGCTANRRKTSTI